MAEKFCVKERANVATGPIRNGSNLTKTERKVLRKQKKALLAMKNRIEEVGQISESPTPYLLVKNGGLMCGIKRCDLFNKLEVFGSLDDIVMLAGKSYSYAMFTDVESSREAVESLNGRKIVEGSSLNDKTLYFGYLLKKPCVETNSSSTSYPHGLKLLENFIDDDEEARLLCFFSRTSTNPECDNSCSNGLSSSSEDHREKTAEKQLRHRHVKHYGYEFLYGTNTVDVKKPLSVGIPDVCSPVLDKVASQGHVEHRPDQLTINEYLPGQGIPPHIDTHSSFEDGIICLSLGAQVTMEFRHPDGRHVPVPLPRRSLLIMSKASRYVWSHGITPRKYDVITENRRATEDVHVGGKLQPQGTTICDRGTRVSLTFRKVRDSPCNCPFPSVCDSGRLKVEGVTKTETMDNDTSCPDIPINAVGAQDLECKHVHNVYENIAEHFSGTRHSPWPKIADFLSRQAPGSLVADVGCGNGKYLGVNWRLFMSGSDRSFNLASICKARRFHVLVCDVLHLPYRSNIFDVCICIAVIHHLSTPDRRTEAIKELVRIVRPGGRVLISVWALEQNLDVKAPFERKAVCKSKMADKKEVGLDENDGERSEVMIDRKGSSGPECLPDMPTKLIVNKTRNKFEQQDLLVPWHHRGKGKIQHDSTFDPEKSTNSKNVVFQRFYHVFTENELENDCRNLGNVSIVRSYYDRGNWCVELEKMTGN